MRFYVTEKILFIFQLDICFFNIIICTICFIKSEFKLRASQINGVRNHMTNPRRESRDWSSTTHTISFVKNLCCVFQRENFFFFLTTQTEMLSETFADRAQLVSFTQCSALMTSLHPRARVCVCWRAFDFSQWRTRARALIQLRFPVNKCIVLLFIAVIPAT